MLTFGLAVLLVGLPAAMGAYLFVNPSDQRDKTASLLLVAYSAALVAAFAVITPEGTLISRAVWLEMPAALVAGLVIGVFTGSLKRSKGK